MKSVIQVPCNNICSKLNTNEVGDSGPM